MNMTKQRKAQKIHMKMRRRLMKRLGKRIRNAEMTGAAQRTVKISAINTGNYEIRKIQLWRTIRKLDPMQNLNTKKSAMVQKIIIRRQSMS